MENILVDEISYGNYLIHDAVYVAKALGITFVKVEGYLRNYGRTKHLASFHPDKKYETTYKRIKYLTMLKRNIPDVYSHYIWKSK